MYLEIFSITILLKPGKTTVMDSATKITKEPKFNG